MANQGRYLLHEKSVMKSQPPNLQSRLCALLIGTWYLCSLAATFSQITRASPVLCFALVLTASIIVMVTLVVFGVKSLQNTKHPYRFNISTVLLVIVPLSVYLSAIRIFLRAMPTRNITISSWFVFGFFSLCFMAFSTAVLLWLAEALMWLAVITLRLIKPRHDRRG